MKCPYCEKEIDHVITASYYYQIQRLDVKGNLTQEYEDMNDAIGDTMFTLCPECDEEIRFDSHGKLIHKSLSSYGFDIGDIVKVVPHEDDDFNEFVGRIDRFRYEYITVVDAEDNAFDVHPWQVSNEKE
jgi:hypothetical protein